VGQLPWEGRVQILPIDPMAITGMVLGSSIVIIPVLGLTLRWSVKPLVEAYARARAVPIGPEQAQRIERLERRVRELEEQLADAQPSPALEPVRSTHLLGR
jgi:hypothetical protein